MKATIVDKNNEQDILDKEYSLKELLKHLNNMTSLSGNHIKLQSSNDNSEYIVIFLWIARNKWKIDCPIELNKVHKQRYATKQEALQILEKIYYNNDVESLKGFSNVPIRHFTLDDMLQFKKEDEMMLRGESPEDSIVTEQPQPKKLTPQKTKAKPKTSMSMGESLNPNSKKVESIAKKVAERKVKDKLADNGSFFEL